MKVPKSTLLFIALLAVVSVACGSRTPEPTAPPPPASTTAATRAPRTRQAQNAKTDVATATPEPGDYLKIVFLLASFDGTRQQQFKQMLTDNTRSVTGTVRIESADGDPAKQREQVDAALDAGAPVLVIQPVDPDGAATFVDEAHKAGAKVIAFDRLINTRDLDAYVSHDYGQAGRLQAQAALDQLQAKGIKPPYNFVFLEGPAGDPVAAGITRGYRQVLDPLIAKSQVKIADDQAVADWSSAQAATTMQATLTKLKNNVQAVLANSSAIAQGALQALDAQKLTDKVFLAGADADLDSLRALCSGSVDLEVMEDDARLAMVAAQLAAAVADDRPIADNPLITGELDVDDRQIPHAAIPVQALTLNSVQAQLVQSDRIPAAELDGCYPPLPQGASVPTTTVTSSVVLWTSDKPDSPAYQYLANLAAQFSSANRGSTIKIVTADKTMRDAFQRGSSANAPDLVWSTNEQVQQFAAANVLQGADVFSPSLYLDAANAAVTFQGARYGIPVSSGNNLLLYYNKKLVKDPPANTDALIRLAPTLTKGDQWTLVYDQTDPFWLIPWIGAYKGAVFAGDTISPTLYTSATVDALNLLKTFQDKKVTPLQSDLPTADAQFQAGKAAMIINGEEALATYQTKLGSDLGTARLPLVTKGDYPHPYTGGTYFAIPRTVSGDRLILAQTFARFVTAKPVQLDMARKLRLLPALRDALNDPALTNDPILKGMADQMLLGIAPPESRALTCAWDAMRPNMQAVLGGKTPAVDAARAMQASAEECVRRITPP